MLEGASASRVLGRGENPNPKLATVAADLYNVGNRLALIEQQLDGLFYSLFGSIEDKAPRPPEVRQEAAVTPLRHITSDVLEALSRVEKCVERLIR